MDIAARRISRREMIAGTLGAGASLLLHQHLWATEAKVDPNRFVLLADTHVSQDPQKVLRETNPFENFKKAREQYGAVNARPAGLIIAGDCVFLKGEPADYQTLRELTASIPMPITFAMGNHDHRENFWEAFSAARAKTLPVPDKHVTVVEAPYADWFVLDSLETTAVTPGKLGEEQLKWLDAQLALRPDKPALVLAHHNPDPPGTSSGLKDMGELLKVLFAHKRAKAYFFGHTHRWTRTQFEGLHLVNISALAWVFDKDQPHAWVDAVLQPNGISLTLQSLDPTHQDHGQRVELAWR